MNDDRKPKYTIIGVVRRVGLSAATLRAWEKRYGAPRPSRAPSRYRLYSDEDVREIQWMRARVEEGIPPRQAVLLARERRAAGLDFVDPGAAARLNGTSLAADLKAYALAYDDEGAQDVIRRALGAMAPTQVIRSVLLPTVAEIGRGYLAGLVTVAQEHFASQIARRFVHRVLDLYPQHSGARLVLCACAPKELHELGLLTLTAELRSRGLRVIYLGQDVPVDALLTTVESERPQYVAVSVTLTAHLRPFRDAGAVIDRTHRTSGATFIWGGPGALQAEAVGLPGHTAPTVDAAIKLMLAS